MIAQESNQGRLEAEILNQLIVVQPGLKPVIHLGSGLPISLLVTRLDPDVAVGRLQTDSGTREEFELKISNIFNMIPLQKLWLSLRWDLRPFRSLFKSRT